MNIFLFCFRFGVLEFKDIAYTIIIMLYSALLILKPLVEIINDILCISLLLLHINVRENHTFKINITLIHYYIRN